LILIDSNIFVAYSVEDDSNHEEAVKVISKIINGDFGLVFTSDYVFDETITVTLIKSKSFEKAIQVGEYIRSSVEILKVCEEIFDDTWGIFKSQKNSKLSFTDCSNIALMKDKGIRYLATFDKEFRKVEAIEVIR